VSTVGWQCSVLRHQLDENGCEKETWENDVEVNIEKGRQKNSRRDASFSIV